MSEWCEKSLEKVASLILLQNSLPMHCTCTLASIVVKCKGRYMRLHCICVTTCVQQERERECVCVCMCVSSAGTV